MYKVRIKGLYQGKHKLEDGSYAVGFRTKYGIVALTTRNFWRFKAQNPHLIKIFSEDWSVDEEDLIGKYVYIREKFCEIEYQGTIKTYPHL